MTLITDVNECEQFVCQNGGLCANVNGSYLCQCPDGWTGLHCEQGKYSKDHTFQKLVDIG